jgi:hypothetical protein
MPDLPEVVSAQVLLAGNGAGDIERLRSGWRAAGFDPGPAVGGTFSIAASPRHFEAVFATRLVGDAEGGVLAGSDRALPLARLPEALRGGVELVTFGRPPSFGPGRR